MSESAAVSATQHEIPLEFRATGSEYFRIWIVNLLLSILTLGIYSAWAKVRRLRYFYGSTALDGSSFEYHGRPIAILKGRLIAFAAYLIVFFLSRVNPVIGIAMLPLFVFGLPWVVMRSRLFQMRMSSWRGLRFNFHGTYWGALGSIVGMTVLGIVTLGILWPLALWFQVNYLLGNNAYGTQRFAFLSTKWSFYRFCLITIAITLGVLCSIVVVLVIVAAVMGASGGLPALPRPGDNPQEVFKVLLSGMFVVAMLVYVVGIMLVAAYFNASFLNTSIGGVQIGPHRVYSRLKTWPMFGILITNLLAMIVTLGLFYPWAKVRMMRYQFAHTGVIADGDLNQFIADSTQGVSATGEEISDIFDIDFGF